MSALNWFTMRVKGDSTEEIDNETGSEDNTPELNTVEDLRKGIIRTKKNEPKSSYTILLVGETGVGKSTFLVFMANVLLGNPVSKYDLTIIDAENEVEGSKGVSQTYAARVYRFISQNGIEVTIVDTPGLADARGIPQDEINKRSIAIQTKRSIASVNAVIVLLNGTVPCLTVSRDYATSTLSALFPKTLASNIAILFTNVSSPPALTALHDSIPLMLRDAPKYLLDNPVALLRKYITLNKNQDSGRILREMQETVRDGEKRALEMLVKLFNWLDESKPQPTSDILSLYEKSHSIEQLIANILSQVEHGNTREEVEDNMANLSTMEEDYANLTLSGGMSAQIEKRCEHLEEMLQEGGINQEQRERVEASLEVTKTKLALIRKELNNVRDLRNGIIRTRWNNNKSPYTILLVGETGVGKSAFLKLIANVLLGNPVFDYDITVIDNENEAGGSQAGGSQAGGSQAVSHTIAARVYNFESQNGIMVTILDTPGLTDPRGIHQDGVHMKSIATEIQRSITSVYAVIILANGTVPRLTVGTDYALSTLSALFPKTLVNNIAFLFTNVSSPLAWNFSQDSVPVVLQDVPRFYLDNPVTLQEKYTALQNHPEFNRMRMQLKQAVKYSEQRTLEMLVKVFDWLDGLTPQPPSDMVSLYYQSRRIEQQITNILALMLEQATKIRVFEMVTQSIAAETLLVDAYSHYTQPIRSYVWKRQESTEHNMLCSETGCYSNCHEGCALNFSLDPSGLRDCPVMKDDICQRCNHSIWKHVHYRVKWKQVPDVQVSIDEGMQKKWTAAKEGKERNELALRDMRGTLDKLSRQLDDHLEKLTDLTADYANLSLIGSFSAQIQKAVNLLEQKLAGMQEGGSEEYLAKVEASLAVMKSKLDMLQMCHVEE